MVVPLAFIVVLFSSFILFSTALCLQLLFMAIV